MNKAEILKEKIASFKKREHDLQIREQVMQSMAPLYQKTYDYLEDRAIDNNSLLISEISSNIAEKLGETNAISKEMTQSIKSLKESLHTTSSQAIVKEVGKILENIKALEDKASFNKERVERIFKDGIDSIVNILVKGDNVANNTSYKRDSRGKITQVIESYDNFTLFHTWSYDSMDNLYNVKTIRKDVKAP